MCQFDDVFNRADAAACDDMNPVDFVEDSFVEPRRRAGEHSVDVDVGRNHLFDAFVDVSVDERHDVGVALFGPSADGDFAVFRVGAEDDAFAAVSTEPTTERVGVGQGDAAAGHHLCAAFEGNSEVFVRLDATTEVDNQVGSRGNGFDDAIVDNMLGFRAVEVYEV